MRDKLLPDCSLITLAVKWLMAKTGRRSKMRWASVKIKREEKRNYTKHWRKERSARRSEQKAKISNNFLMHFARSFGTVHTVHFQMIAVHLSSSPSLPLPTSLCAPAAADVCATSVLLRAPRSGLAGCEKIVCFP